MSEMPSYAKWPKFELIDACVHYGIPPSGTKSDLVTRLYDHTIETWKLAFEGKKNGGFSHDLNDTTLLAEVAQIKAGMLKAAREQSEAETKYVEKRLKRITKSRELAEEKALKFAKCETSRIRGERQARAERERERVAARENRRRASRSANREVREMASTKTRTTERQPAARSPILTKVQPIRPNRADSARTLRGPAPRSSATLSATIKSSPRPALNSARPLATVSSSRNNAAKPPAPTLKKNALGIRLKDPKKESRR